jgi:3-oxoacyl-[acyl-carrier protein] reductase
VSADARVALVIGGAGALGSAIATLLAERGARVAVGYSSRADAAQSLAGQLPDAIPVELDVADGESIQAAFRAVAEGLGTTTILVNCAGIVRDRPSVRMHASDWQEVIDTNLSGAFHCAKRALPGMFSERFGRIVTIGSISGAIGPAGQANYAAAKAGLTGMTKALSREVARRGVTVNVIAPGLVSSPLSERLDPRLRELYASMSATRREVDPRDVARAVLFCVECPSLTGQVINVDGGIT